MASWMWLRTQVKTVMDVVRRIEEVLQAAMPSRKTRRKEKAMRKKMEAVDEEDTEGVRKAGNAP